MDSFTFHFGVSEVMPWWNLNLRLVDNQKIWRENLGRTDSHCFLSLMRPWRTDPWMVTRVPQPCRVMRRSSCHWRAFVDSSSLNCSPLRLLNSLLAVIHHTLPYACLEGFHWIFMSFICFFELNDGYGCSLAPLATSRIVGVQELSQVWLSESSQWRLQLESDNAS